MSEKRKLLRHAIVRILTTEKDGAFPTDAETRVFANRPTPLWSSELPAICVYIKSEPAEKTVTAPVVYSRKPRIVVEALVAATDECDDLLDAMQEQIENALFANCYLMDPVDGVERLDEELVLESTEMGLVQLGDGIVGSNSITFKAGFHTESPELLYGDDLDDFNSANVKTDLNGDSEAEMENTVTVRREP